MSNVLIPEREIIRVGSSNLLNDADHPKWTAQHERRYELIDLINSVRPDSGAFIHFLNEAVDEPTISLIAIETDAVVVGEPVEYVKDQSYMAFLSDKSTSSKSKTEFTATSEKNEELGFMTMYVDELALFGFHPPHMPWGNDQTERNYMFKKITEQADSSDQTILLGDSNMSPLSPTRRKLIKDGFKEAHAGDRPPFPTDPDFRGKTMRWYTPNSSLDVIFFRGDGLRLVEAGYKARMCSDHPTTWADLLVSKQRQLELSERP